MSSRVSIFQNLCGKIFLSAARAEVRCDLNSSQSRNSEICLIPLRTLVLWLSEGSVLFLVYVLVSGFDHKTA